MLALFISSFAIGFVVAIFFGMPPWLIALWCIGVLVSIVWYILNSRWHNRRTVSGEGVQDDLAYAEKPYLTLGERVVNFYDKIRHRPPRYLPRNEIARLYPRNGHH